MSYFISLIWIPESKSKDEIYSTNEYCKILHNTISQQDILGEMNCDNCLFDLVFCFVTL